MRSEVTKHLRSPAPCTDAAAAQLELRRWWASIQRAMELGIRLPDVRELYRACLSIFSSVLSEHPDPQIQHLRTPRRLRRTVTAVKPPRQQWQLQRQSPPQRQPLGPRRAVAPQAPQPERVRRARNREG